MSHIYTERKSTWTVQGNVFVALKTHAVITGLDVDAQGIRGTTVCGAA